MKKTITVVAGAAILYLLIAIHSNAEKLVEAAARMELQLVVLAVFFTLTNYLLRFVKWEVYCKRAGINISMKSSLLIFLGGMSMTITPGKAGELVKAYLLKQGEGVEMSRGVLVVIAERITDALAMISLTVVSIAYMTSFSSFMPDIRSALLSIMMVFSIILAGVLGVRSEKFTNFLVKKFRIRRTFQNLIREILRFRLTVEMTALSMLSWLMECIALYLIIRAFGLKISVFGAIFVFSMSTIAGVLSMLPAGIGVTELSMMYLLTRFGIPQLEASASTIITRAVTLWLGVMLGTIALYIYGRRAR